MISWTKRILIFLLERYSPHLALMHSFLASFSYFLTAKLVDQIHTSFAFCLITAVALFNFLFVMVMRIADEHKDCESDKIHFPKRCLPSGRVRFFDIQILALLGLALIFFLHFSFATHALTHYLFIALMIYLFLFYRYFFMPQIISNNIILALITHNPLLFVLGLYLFSFFFPYPTRIEFYLFPLGMWMQALIWEVARKIKTASEETQYQTYSSLLGPRVAILLPLAGMSVLTYAWNKVVPAPYLYFSILVFYFLFLGHFALKLKQGLWTKIRPVTEACIFLLNLIVVVKGWMFQI